ncbi:MAG: helix-hairpin-helix domain-containing protein, partial [Calditrichaceae bacterium]
CQTVGDSLLLQWAEFVEDDDNLGEILQELAENPVNINSNNPEELKRIPLISKFQIDSILQRRKRLGTYRSKRQIRPVIGPQLYELVKDFITIHSKSMYSISATHKSHIGIEPVKEIENKTYLGDKLYDYNKIKATWSDQWRIGLVTQKDIGEVNYIDYMNGYLEYNQKRFKIIAGSFYCHFGEGLAFSNAYGQKKSSIASLAFRSNNQGGFATTSSSENSGLFGLSLNFYRIFGSDLHLFYSHINRDAQYSPDNDYITGFNYTGYHRSESEIARKDKITETLFGACWQRNFFNSFILGLQTANISYKPKIVFNKDISGENAYRRQYFKFTGSEINQYSIFYRYNSNHIQLQGEYAGSEKGSPALTQSVFIEDKKINFGIKYWRLGKNFQSPFGRVFDNSNPFPQAEEGVYFGLELQPAKELTLNAFKIIKKDLWRTYFDKLPKLKDESFIELNYQPNNLILSARLRIKNNEYFNYAQGVTPVARNIEQQNIYRLQFEYRPARTFAFRTRWEFTQLKILKEHGSYLYEDISYSPSVQLSIRTRFIVYRTDSYNSRLYEFESDLPGSFSNYAVFGEGRIFYFLVKWKLVNNISIWLKYRYGLIINRELTAAIIRNDDYQLQRGLRFQLKIQL